MESFIKTPIFDSGLPLSVQLAGVSHPDPSYRIHRECSDVWVIEYVISGRGTVKTKNGIFYPRGGDTYILAEGDEHEYYSSNEEPWEKIWINVSGRLANALVESYGLDKHTLFHFDSYEYLCRLHALLSENDASARELMDRCSLVLHELFQGLSLSVAEQKHIPKEAVALKNYIDTNIYSSLTIDELSALIYKSPSQAIRLFKKHYGMTPYDYYNANRIKKAVSLLENTIFSVKEIAYRLGFSDEHYFSSFFKKKTGKRPTDFRMS